MPSRQLMNFASVAAGLVSAALAAGAVYATATIWVVVLAAAAALAAIGATCEPVRAACSRVELELKATEPTWAIAAVAGTLGALAALKYDNSSHLVVVLVATIGAVWAAWIDLRSKRIPTVFLYFASGATLIASAAIDLPAQGVSKWASTLAVAAAGTAVLLGVALLTAGRAVGAADIRLMPLLGIVAGYRGWPTLWSTFIFAIIVMFPMAFVSMIRRRRDPDSAPSALPFAPGLVVGLALSIAIT